MRLQEIMTTDVVTIGPDEAASTAWSRMERKQVRHLVVAEGKRLLGVISERDLGGPHGGTVRRGRTVRDLMTPSVAVATPETTLRQAANLMRGRLIGSLPVIDDQRVVGIVTATDVLAELGRGSSRPKVRAKRQSMRLPPASARTAKREAPRARAPQGPRRAKKGQEEHKRPWGPHGQRGGTRQRLHRDHGTHYACARPQAHAPTGQPPPFTVARPTATGGEAEGGPHRHRRDPRPHPLNRIGARCRRQALSAAQARPKARQVRVRHRAHECAGRGCQRSTRRCRQALPDQGRVDRAAQRRRRGAPSFAASSAGRSARPRGTRSTTGHAAPQHEAAQTKSA